jgi:hypothetical protein
VEILTISQTSDSTLSMFQPRNLSTGTSAALRIAFGTSGSSVATTMTQFGTNHATKPNVMQLMAQITSLELGSYGAVALTLGANQTATFTSVANTATISVSDWIYAPGIDGGTGTNVVLTAGGYIVADTSTERTKKNITRKWKPQAGIIDALYALEPIKYDYIATPGKGTGRQGSDGSRCDKHGGFLRRRTVRHGSAEYCKP